MAKVKLPSGKTVKVPDGMTKEQVIEYIFEKLPDTPEWAEDKARLGDKLDTSGWGKTIGGAIGGIGGAAAGFFGGAGVGAIPGAVAGGAAGGALGESIEQWITGKGDWDDIGKAGLTEGAWGLVPGGVGQVAKGAQKLHKAKQLGTLAGAGGVAGGTEALVTGDNVAAGAATGAVGATLLGSAVPKLGGAVADLGKGLYGKAKRFTGLDTTNPDKKVIQGLSGYVAGTIRGKAGLQAGKLEAQKGKYDMIRAAAALAGDFTGLTAFLFKKLDRLFGQEVGREVTEAEREELMKEAQRLAREFQQEYKEDAGLRARIAQEVDLEKGVKPRQRFDTSGKPLDDLSEGEFLFEYGDKVVGEAPIFAQGGLIEGYAVGGLVSRVLKDVSEEVASTISSYIKSNTGKTVKEVYRKAEEELPKDIADGVKQELMARELKNQRTTGSLSKVEPDIYRIRERGEVSGPTPSELKEFSGKKDWHYTGRGTNTAPDLLGSVERDKKKFDAGLLDREKPVENVPRDSYGEIQRNFTTNPLSDAPDLFFGDPRYNRDYGAVNYGLKYQRTPGVSNDTVARGHQVLRGGKEIRREEPPINTLSPTIPKRMGTVGELTRLEKGNAKVRKDRMQYLPEEVRDLVPLIEKEVNKGFIPMQDRRDALSRGIKAVLEAKETFDPTKGTKFSTHAHKYITSAIKNPNEIQSATRRESDFEVTKGSTSLDQQRAIGGEDDDVGTLHDVLSESLGDAYGGAAPKLSPDVIREIKRDLSWDARKVFNRLMDQAEQAAKKKYREGSSLITPKKISDKEIREELGLSRRKFEEAKDELRDVLQNRTTGAELSSEYKLGLDNVRQYWPDKTVDYNTGRPVGGQGALAPGSEFSIGRKEDLYPKPARKTPEKLFKPLSKDIEDLIRDYRGTTGVESIESGLKKRAGNNKIIQEYVNAEPLSKVGEQTKRQIMQETPAKMRQGMDELSQEIYAALPNEVTVYRMGTRKKSPDALSWSLDPNYVTSARGHLGGYDPNLKLYSAKVKKGNISHIVGKTGETEVIVKPEFVSDWSDGMSVPDAARINAEENLKPIIEEAIADIKSKGKIDYKTSSLLNDAFTSFNDYAKKGTPNETLIDLAGQFQRGEITTEEFSSLARNPSIPHSIGSDILDASGKLQGEGTGGGTVDVVLESLEKLRDNISNSKSYDLFNQGGSVGILGGLLGGSLKGYKTGKKKKGCGLLG